MNNLKFFNLYKKYPIMFLTILLVISLTSALFMPTMLTFYFTLPLLILFALKQLLSWTSFWTAIAIIIISVVLVIGFVIYIQLFILFIHCFPTYVVLLIALLLTHLIPIKLNFISKMVVFLSLSTLIGFNTQIMDVFQKKHLVEEKINSIISLNREDIVKITGNNVELPSSYNSYDFITFGANEGIGGFWEYPKIETVNLLNLLQQREISYTHKNKSPYTIDVNSSKNNNKHIVNIQIKSNTKLISSIKITDQLPYQSSINKEELDNFDQRLEYLLRHNIWNALLFFSTINSKTNNSSIINEFLDKSIKYNAKHADWSKNTYFIEGNLIKNEEKGFCSADKNNDYKNYMFNRWKDQSSDKSARIGFNHIFSFESNNTTYSTKILSTYSNKMQAYNETLWNDYAFSYSTENNIYVFYTFRLAKNIRILQFEKTGQFVREWYVGLPKNILLDGRDYHPISNIELVDNKMQFRVYNIYEFNATDNFEAAAPPKDQCSFNQIEIQLP
ncbi:MAG: hypothetical protein PHU40_12020 [Sulfurimonas sp.]|nr:hypothetical protein [Sulfurimonas sp.]